MPNVYVLKKELFAHIGKEFSDQEFEDLCFEFGIEMEYGTAEGQNMNRVDGDGNAVDISKEMVYKIEVAANRYDMLCVEGIAAAIKSYIGVSDLPKYAIKMPDDGKLEQIIVKPETKEVRPYVVGCILRNINFDIARYNSFIDLQDKLHQNLCRRRTLGSMGTHDYDKLQGPITYEAHPPKDIVFKALKQTEEMDTVKLFEKFKGDMKMKKFLPIIENFDKYPVFYDKNRQVLSLPPIINSEATKITLNTKNVFVEITGTDLQKIKVSLAIIGAQFSEYCDGDNKFHIEPVEIKYEGDEARNETTPQLKYHEFNVEIDRLNKLLGVTLDKPKIAECAKKMGLNLLSADDKTVQIQINPVRADILHPCDVIEDIGIGYGFNNIPKVFPPTNTVGSFMPLNKFTDLLRHELAQAGYIECLTGALLSIKDNYLNMRLEANMDEAVQLSNPKTLEYELVRTSLIPGLLKTLQSNKKESIPQRIFEISDIVKIDESHETGAKNHRRVCVMQLDTQASFHIIHGTLDLIMTKVGAKVGQDYKIQESNNPSYFPKRGADVVLKGKVIGSLGVVHPEVLGHFELKYPVSCFELSLEELFDHFKQQ